MQVEKREAYELQLVKAIVTGCQWHGAKLVLKTQQPVMLEEGTLQSQRFATEWRVGSFQINIIIK